MKKAKIESGLFERREKKHLISAAQCAELTERLTGFAERDRYASYTLSSLYYDTDDFALIRQSLDKPAFKQKLRVRSYGTPGEGDSVYLELKKKFNGVTYKRRISLPLGDCRAYLDRGVSPETEDWSFGEIGWFVRQRPLFPKVLISYDRMAFTARSDPELRLTIDRAIRWRSTDLDLASGDFGASLLPPGQCLFEVKTDGALPLWLVEILSELRIYQCSFSKYGTIYSRHLACGGEGLRDAG